MRYALVLCLSVLAGCPSSKTDADGNPIKVGRFRLRTFPSGAKVWIDGELKVESTPATLILDPGSYHLKMQLEGAEPYEKTIEIEAGDVVDRTYRLPPPPPSTVTVESDYEGAKVRINGYTRGYTPLEKARTKPGWIDITVTLPDGRARAFSGRLGIGENKVVELPFTDDAPPAPGARTSTVTVTGQLTLGLKPDGEVFDEDERSLGETPLVGKVMPAGTHHLILRSLDRRYERQVQVVVPPKKLAVYRFRFEPGHQLSTWKPDGGP